jgi:hypothetical protein
VLVAACASDEASEPASDVPAGTPMAIEETARLRVGVAAGDSFQELDRVVSPFLLPDGRLVVPSRGHNSIRVFSSTGEYVTTLGRQGEGPGEFTALLGAWARGDTIEALDLRLMRITRFLPNDSLEVVSLRSDRLREMSIGGPAPDGWFAGGIGVSGYDRDDRRDEMIVHRFARSGTNQGRMSSAPGMYRIETPVIGGPGPMSPKAAVEVVGGRLFVAETLTPRIEVFDGTGALATTVSWVPAPTMLPEEARAAVVDSLVARADPDQAAAVRQEWESFPIPERLSVFWAFIVDDEGFIWVRPYEPLKHASAFVGFLGGGGPGGSWTILSPEGTELGTVQVPEDLEPMRITTDEVVGIARDEYGVESVRVHALRRR